MHVLDVYVCMLIGMNVGMYACMYVMYMRQLDGWARFCFWILVCICYCTYKYVCVCMYVCINVYICMCICMYHTEI